MNKTLVIITFLVFFFNLYSKPPTHRKIIEVQGDSDTISVEFLNRYGETTFKKIKSEFINNRMVLAHNFDDKEEVNFTWCHLTQGIRFHEYETKKNKRFTYLYKLPTKTPLNEQFFANVNSIKDLFESKEFKEVYKAENKKLYAIEHLKNKKVLKKIYFKDNGDTSRIETYKYKKGQVIELHRKFNTGSTISTYTIDGQGREIQFLQTNSTGDTVTLTRSEYLEDKKTKRTNYRRGKFQYVKYYFYTNGQLSEELTFRENNSFTRKQEYKYYPDGKLWKKIDNFYSHFKFTENTYYYK